MMNEYTDTLHYQFVNLKKVKNSTKYDIYYNNNNVFLGDVIIHDDGYYYYWPTQRRGAWSSYVMKDIASALDELNMPWEEYFKQQDNS